MASVHIFVIPNGKSRSGVSITYQRLSVIRGGPVALITETSLAVTLVIRLMVASSESSQTAFLSAQSADNLGQSTGSV